MGSGRNQILEISSCQNNNFKSIDSAALRSG
jgi:hypothetical protein